MRTYYTWKTFELEDVTYYTFKMGLWTLAETSTGLIICCLPILPRFFQFISPKIRKSFSLSAYHVGLKDKKPCASFKPTMTNKPAFQARHDPYHSDTLIGNDSIALVRPSSKSTAAESTIEPGLSPNDRQRVADDDLESGQHEVLDWVARVEMDPDTPDTTSPDWAEPKMARAW